MEEPNPRIVSLVPSATEIAAILGLERALVGRSHECDWPAGIERLPALTRPRIDPAAPSAEIHDRVVRLLRAALGIYDLDSDLLARLAPTHVITQTQCEVCAVGLDQVEAALASLVGRPAEIVALAPVGLADVFADIRRVAAVFGVDDAVADRLEARVAACREAARPRAEHARPRVVCIEWCSPLMVAGNWVPEIVALAGGVDPLGAPGAQAPRITSEALFAAEPDRLIFMPCGFDLARSIAEARALLAEPGWRDLAAVRARETFAVDGNRYFNRPGPRLVDSLEIMAEMLQPTRFDFGHEGDGWRRLDPASADSPNRAGPDSPRATPQGGPRE